MDEYIWPFLQYDIRVCTVCTSICTLCQQGAFRFDNNWLCKHLVSYSSSDSVRGGDRRRSKWDSPLRPACSRWYEWQSLHWNGPAMNGQAAIQRATILQAISWEPPSCCFDKVPLLSLKTIENNRTFKTIIHIQL